jgi:hypothetical protein
MYSALRASPLADSGPPLRAFVDASRRSPASLTDQPLPPRFTILFRLRAGPHNPCSGVRRRAAHPVVALATVLLAPVPSFGRSDATLSRLGNAVRPHPYTSKTRTVTPVAATARSPSAIRSTIWMVFMCATPLTDLIEQLIECAGGMCTTNGLSDYVLREP